MGQRTLAGRLYPSDALKPVSDYDRINEEAYREIRWIRQYRKPPEAHPCPAGRRRAEAPISLAAQGEAFREKASPVPPAMQGCIALPKEELPELKRLLARALLRMEAHT